MKESIFLIPGLMTNKKLWKRLFPLMKNSYEVIHLPIPKCEDFDKINDFLSNSISEEKINLLGFSLGSYIATYFSIKNPNRVKRLFNLSGTPSFTSEIKIKKRKERIYRVKEEGFSPLGYEKASLLVENQNDEEVIKLIETMYDELGKEYLISQLKLTLYRKDLLKDIKNLDFPIFYYYSNKDRFLNHSSIEALNKMNLKNVKIFKRNGYSHNIPLEDSKNLFNFIKLWMQSV